MSEEIELKPKINCGIWTAIENYINKENDEKIWDHKNIPPKSTVTRKKEKIRVRWDKGKLNCSCGKIWKISNILLPKEKFYHRCYHL